MKSKSKLFRLIRRWPTIVALVLSFCLLICQAFYIAGVQKQKRAQNLACAELAARQGSVHFKQLVNSTFDSMRVAAAELGQSDAEDAELLDTLAISSGIARIALVRDGEMYVLQNSELIPQEDTHTVTRYGISNGCVLAVQDDGEIRLCATYDRGELIVWPNVNSLTAQLNKLLEGDFGYIVFNSMTGDCLINHSDIEQNYYEFLMALVDEPDGVDGLLRNKNAVTALKINGDSHLSYIAQCRTGLNFWSMAFIIPEDSLPSAEGTGTTAQIVAFIAVSLLLFVITFGALAELLKLRRSQISRRRLLNAFNSMADRAVAQSKQAIFVYQRDNETVPMIKDGMELMNPAVKEGRMRDIVQGFGLSPEDGEKLTDAIHALQPGEESTVVFSGADRGSEEHTLQFVLTRMQDESNLVCAIVRDCTQERFNREREIEEIHYGQSMRQKANMIWRYNVSRGNWQLIFVRGFDPARIGVVRNEWRNSDEDIADLLHTLLHCDDYDLFASRMRAEAVAEMCHCGRDETEMEYRLKIPGDSGYSWYRQSMRVFRTPETNDIMADIYVMNVDAEKRAEMERSERRQILQQTQTALGSIFYGLYYINLDTDTSYTVKSLGGDMVTQLADSFEKQFAEYVKSRVHPDDQAHLLDLLTCYRLKRTLTEQKPSLLLQFRRRSGDMFRTSTLIIQAARFENASVREIVLALRKDSEEN